MPVDLIKTSLSLGPLFEGLQEGERRVLAEKAVIRTFPKNAVVISEGEFTASLYLVLSGKAKVCLIDESGKELVLDVKGPGEYFGEMALDERPRSASVVTVEPSKFAVIAKTDFERLLLEHPEIALQVIKNLIHVVRGLNRNVRSLAMLNAYGRVSKLLRDLAVDQDGKLVIVEKLTKQDIANRVGSSRETISRIFKDLARGGYIKVEGKKITINKALPPRL